MSEHISARPDLSLLLRRRLFGLAARAAALPPLRALAARSVAPSHPALALAQGESLVTTPRRVLALTAHPDDLEFFAGGILRRMALAGSQITAMVFSDGEKRGNWRDLGGRRRQEQLLAARLQGYGAVHFLGLPDFGLPEDPRLEHLVARAWDQVGPEVVFVFDPKELLPRIANRDHKALGRTVLDLARSRLDGRTAVYLYGTHHPDVLVDITAVLPDKLRAVKAHRSQMVYLSDGETNAVMALLGRIYAGRSGCRYAEPLYRLM